MSRAGGIDDRLRQLLDLEQRLEALVRAAEEAAADRIAQARADADRRRADSEAEQSGQADAQDAADRAEHEVALQSITADTQAAIRSLSSISDDRIDELARLVLDRVLAPGGGTP